MTDSVQKQAIEEILAERTRQDAKWGTQEHDPIVWQAILSEEVGEFVKEVLSWKYGWNLGNPSNLKMEAIYVAAMAMAIVECLDREK